MKDLVIFKKIEIPASLNLILTLLLLLLLAKFVEKKLKEMHCKHWVLFITFLAFHAATAEKTLEQKSFSIKITKLTVSTATNPLSFQPALVAKKPLKVVILKL